ncbi:MAG: T9SS type A sorting domain-containing protein [Flavobacterium sp.]|nr:T9SS type A sorting domain-containing protein [Flavobacterium sp.]
MIAVGSTINLGGVTPNLTVSPCGGINSNDAVLLCTVGGFGIDLWGKTDGSTFTPLGQPGYTYRRHADAPVPSMTWNPEDWDVFDPEDYTNVGTYSAAVSYSYSLDGGPWQTSTLFSQLSIGLHTISVQNNNTGEETQTTFDIVPAIPNLPVTNFIYQSPVCQRDFLLYPITTSNFTAGGTFLATPFVAINPITGSIELNQTPPGNYVVSYFVPADLTNCTLAGSSSFNLTILPTSPTPQGNANQMLTMPNPTITNLIVSPTEVSWYNSFDNAMNQTNPLIGATPLVDGATYYAVNNSQGCPSDPFPVTVQLVLSNTAFTDFSFAIVPNPAGETLYIQTANQMPIDKIIIRDISGKTVINATSAGNEVAVDRLAAGMYIIEVFSNNQKSQAKFIKR